MEIETGESSLSNIDSNESNTTNAKKRKKSKEKSQKNDLLEDVKEQLNLLTDQVNKLRHENELLKKENSTLRKKKEIKASTKKSDFIQPKKNSTEKESNNRFNLLPEIEGDMIEMESIDSSVNTENPEKIDILKKIQKANLKMEKNINISKSGYTKSHNNSNMESIETKYSKMPPICVFNQNVKDTITLLKEKLQISEFYIKNTKNNRFTIQSFNLKNYLKIRDLLEKAKSKFYSYTPKEIKSHLLVLRGLDKNENTDDIIEYIKDMNEHIEVNKIYQLTTPRSTRDNISLPIYIVQVKSEEIKKELKLIKYLNHQKIYWEDYEKKDAIIQCVNCQRFGHVASNCQMGYRCVKCIESHKPGECKISDKEPDKEIYCVLCKQNGHPASYRGCPYYKNLETKLKTNRSSNVKKTQEKQNQFINNYVKSNVSFADIIQDKRTPVSSKNTMKNNLTINNNNDNLNLILSELKAMRKDLEDNSNKTEFLMKVVSDMANIHYSDTN